METKEEVNDIIGSQKDQLDGELELRRGNSTKSLSEKWLPAITFTIYNMQNRNGYSDIVDLL